MEQEGGIMIDLKRCPFCKGMARFENSKDAEDDYITMLICNGCDIRTRFARYATHRGLLTRGLSYKR